MILELLSLEEKIKILRGTLTIFIVENRTTLSGYPEHYRQQENYPALEERIFILENSTEKIIIELDNLVGILAKREGS